MKVMIYEDNVSTPISKCLKRNEDMHVKLVFSAGNWGLAECINKLTKKDKAIVFLDMPPNNKYACGMFAEIMEETKRCECDFVLIPVICTEYYVLKHIITENCFKAEIYRKLYQLLVVEFRWQEAVPYIIEAGIVKEGKPKSIEKIYKAILNNTEYRCFHNTGDEGRFYQTECGLCKYYNAKEMWERCTSDKKAWSLEEKAAYIYSYFPVYYSTWLTEKYLNSPSAEPMEEYIHKIALECTLQYIAMCKCIGEESVFNEHMLIAEERGNHHERYH